MVEAAVSGKYTPQEVLHDSYGCIVNYWHNFDFDGLARSVPGLKHWSDKAACEFVRFRTSCDLEAKNYQRYKRELHFTARNQRLFRGQNTFTTGSLTNSGAGGVSELLRKNPLFFRSFFLSNCSILRVISLPSNGRTHQTNPVPAVVIQAGGSAVARHQPAHA